MLLHLVAALPLSKRLQRLPASDLHGRIQALTRQFTQNSSFSRGAAVFSDPQKRHFSRKGQRDDNEDEDGDASGNSVNPENDNASVSAEEANDASSSALVKNRVPDNVPELLAIPVSRRPVFPGFYKTITVKDPKVASALAQSLKRGRPYVGLFMSCRRPSSQTESTDSKASPEGLPEEDTDVVGSLGRIHRVGVFAQIINVITMPNDGATAIVFPHRRIRALQLLTAPDAPVSRVRVENVLEERGPQEKQTDDLIESIDDQGAAESDVKSSNQPHPEHQQVIRAITQEIYAVMADIAKLNPFFREHVTHHNVSPVVFEDAAKLADFCAVLSSGEAEELQELLETTNVEDRLKRALVLLKKELVTAQLQHSISRDVEQKMTQRQREYFLHEQLKSIKKELGLEADSKEKLLEQFRSRAASLQMPEAVAKVFEEEMAKLAVLEPAGSEFNVCRNYLDWLTVLPWGRITADKLDCDEARQVLDRDHYGMEEVKERILEFIAVSKLRGGVSGKILCLVGPPGVGKTSIGKSVAAALGRQYFRFSVGGLGDVAEIKGHRRTYVGAMPGKVVQALKKVQSSNPLLLIDEVDKMSSRGVHGDPASALLELLDPEQNGAFLDHYLDVPIDLSGVLFMCTANTLDTIPPPLLDRMEVIQLSGYVSEEKVEIAKRYLIPTIREASGVRPEEVIFEDSALEALLRQYCRESGVRNLKKQIEKIFRKAALQLVRGREEEKEDKDEEKDGRVGDASQKQPITISADNLPKYVGNPVYTSDRLFNHLPVGTVTGMAWTANGGTILYIETLMEEASQQRQHQHNKPAILTRTGQLGKVMEESVQIAYSYAKAYLAKHYAPPSSLDSSNHASTPPSTILTTSPIHLHVPEGATPKDGPSAGITMATALISCALNRTLPSDLAMTGELSLTGRVLRVGGIKEKVIAAKRAAIKRVILPAGNRSEWEEIPEHVRSGVEPHFVETFEEIGRILGLDK